MFEIEEKGSFQAGNVEVAKHLGDVVIIEGIDHLGIDDDGVVDNPDIVVFTEFFEIIFHDLQTSWLVCLH